MTLGLLVGRLGGFLEERAGAQSEPSRRNDVFPSGVGRVREELNHHLIPLLLLARADGESVASERQAIFHYCAGAMESTGAKLSPDESAALGDYIDTYRPTRTQLASALRRLEAEPRERILALVAAAQTVVAADKEHRSGEMQFLANIANDLAAL